jgi:hypothetical protein
MFTLVEATAEKRKIQQGFRRIFENALAPQGERIVGHPGGAAKVALFSSGAGTLWCGFHRDTESPISRYWNPFGIFEPDHSTQTITAELNIPIDTNNELVAGFFAKDTDSRLIYLMHTGRIGGGRKGIGKSAFLAWSKLRPVPVFQSDGGQRMGIVIGPIKRDVIVERVSKFVDTVSKFKALAASGGLDTPDFRQELEEYERFSPEFSGRKKGHKGGTFDYICYHGDIVNALYRFREANKGTDEKVLSTQLMDLYVKRRSEISEIYEVKTGAERQALYTALGQLIVHSGGDMTVRRIIVLPKEEKLPHDVAAAISAVNISIWRFTLHRDK